MVKWIVERAWIGSGLQRSKAGMSGHFHEPEPEMIGEPLAHRNRRFPVCPRWSEEISGTHGTGILATIREVDGRRI
jgi:hypothetical protein